VLLHTTRLLFKGAEDTLRDSAGNFYINTKSMGSVVAQQPFGVSRGSGTIHKVGSFNAISRFLSVRAIKEDFVGLKEVECSRYEV